MITRGCIYKCNTCKYFISHMKKHITLKINFMMYNKTILFYYFIQVICCFCILRVCEPKYKRTLFKMEICKIRPILYFALDAFH